MNGRVLVVAGSDSGGGAGIQADIKTITALGGYAATAVTALTAQNTEGVLAIQDVPADFVAQQMTLVLDDIGADVIKTGMLHRAELFSVWWKLVDATWPKWIYWWIQSCMPRVVHRYWRNGRSGH